MRHSFHWPRQCLIFHSLDWLRSNLSKASAPATGQDPTWVKTPVSINRLVSLHCTSAASWQFVQLWHSYAPTLRYHESGKSELNTLSIYHLAVHFGQFKRPFMWMMAPNEYRGTLWSFHLISIDHWPLFIALAILYRASRSQRFDRISRSIALALDANRKHNSTRSHLAAAPRQVYLLNVYWPANNRIWYFASIIATAGRCELWLADDTVQVIKWWTEMSKKPGDWAADRFCLLGCLVDLPSSNRLFLSSFFPSISLFFWQALRLYLPLAAITGSSSPFAAADTLREQFDRLSSDQIQLMDHRLSLHARF